MSRNNIYFYDTHAQRFVDLEEDDANINTMLQKVPKNRYMAKQTLYKRWKKDEHWWYNEPMVVNKKKKKKPFSKGELLNNDRLCLRNSLSDCTWYTLYKLMCRAL